MNDCLQELFRAAAPAVSGGTQTLSRNGGPLAWDARGDDEVALDAGSLALSP